MADLEQDSSSRSSSRGSSFSLCHMTESAYAKVIFCEIHDSYSADSDVECLYQLSESVVPHPDDYIGLFRVGWQDLDECITSVPCASASRNASLAGDSYNKIIFKVKDLPKDDLEYYQFLYLTGDRDICGASTPFKFHTVNEDENVVVLSAEHDFLEVKSSASLLHHRLAETQKYVAFLEKAKKELEGKIVKMEKENEAKEKMEKVNLVQQEEFETQLQACLTSILEGSEALAALPKCSETLEELIYSVKAMVNRLSKDNASLKMRNSILQRDLCKVKADFDSCKSRELQTAMRSTVLADSVKSSLELLSKENAELKAERSSLHKALSDTKDLFRASEECKSLVRQELENVKKSKDEMSDSMEDLKLLNSLLKKQLANNENAIKEMEKVWKELENVKMNFDSEKDSWDKQRNELEYQVLDLTVRLKEAAELYKKQFLEIRNLKKQLKSYDSSRRKFSDDAVVPSNDRVRCSSSDSIPSAEGPQTPSFMTQSLSSLSDSSTAELVLKTEKEQLQTAPNSRPTDVSTSYLAWSTCSFPAEITVDKATAPSEEKSSLPKVETSSGPSSFAAAALGELMITESISRNLLQEQEAANSSVVPPKVNSSSYQHRVEMFDLPCPLCDTLITVYDNNTSIMDEHLLEVHNQQLCPVCGRMFDKGLPSNYFKYHVENHFTGVQSDQ